MRLGTFDAVSRKRISGARASAWSFVSDAKFDASSLGRRGLRENPENVAVGGNRQPFPRGGPCGQHVKILKFSLG